jgi:hypothetical protein
MHVALSTLGLWGLHVAWDELSLSGSPFSCHSVWVFLAILILHISRIRSCQVDYRSLHHVAHLATPYPVPPGLSVLDGLGAEASIQCRRRLCLAIAPTFSVRTVMMVDLAPPHASKRFSSAWFGVGWICAAAIAARCIRWFYHVGMYQTRFDDVGRVRLFCR